MSIEWYIVLSSLLFAVGALGGAVGVVAMRNPFYGVLALVVHLFSLAVLFLLLELVHALHLAVPRVGRQHG